MGAGFYHFSVGAGLHNLSVVKYLRDRAPTSMVKCGIDRSVKRDYYVWESLDQNISFIRRLL